MPRDLSTPSVIESTRIYRTEAEWRALMAEFARWEGSQASFCEARGVSLTSFQNWRRKLGLVTRRGAGTPHGSVEVAPSCDPVWDVELSLGDGVILRLRRS